MKPASKYIPGKRDIPRSLRKWMTLIMLVSAILLQAGTAIAQSGTMNRPEDYIIEREGIIIVSRLDEDCYIYLFVEAHTGKWHIKCRNYQNELIWETALTYKGVAYTPNGLCSQFADDAYLVSCSGNAMEETMLIISNRGEIIGSLPVPEGFYYLRELPEYILWQTDRSTDAPYQIMLSDKQGRFFKTQSTHAYSWFSFKSCVALQDGSILALGYKVDDEFASGAILCLDESFSVKWRYIHPVESALTDAKALPNGQIAVVGMEMEADSSGMRDGLILLLDAEGKPLNGLPIVTKDCYQFDDVRVDDGEIKAYGCDNAYTIIYTIGVDGSIKAIDKKVIFDTDEGSHLRFTFNREGEVYLFGGLHRNEAGYCDFCFFAPYNELDSLCRRIID